MWQGVSTIKHALSWMALLHCFRKTPAHVAYYTRVNEHFPRYTRVRFVISILHPALYLFILSLANAHFTFQFFCSRCKPKKKTFLHYSCLKMFFYLLVPKLTVFSCSEEISLFTRSFLASNLSALTNMFCLWVSKSTSRAAVDCTSRLRTKIQNTRCH